MNLGNAAAAQIRRFQVLMDAGAAQMIIFKSAAVTTNPSPGTACSAFSGIGASKHPLFMALPGGGDLTFPTVAQGTLGPMIAASQMVELEFHIVNSTAGSLNVGATLIMDITPVTASTIASDMFLTGTAAISVAPSATDINQEYSSPPPLTKLIALSTQQWRFGTQTHVYLATNPTDFSNEVYANNNWALSPISVFSPVRDLSSVHVLTSCTTNNTSLATVAFGPSAITDEVCFAWGYYYPAGGFQLCLGGTCTTTP